VSGKIGNIREPHPEVWWSFLFNTAGDFKRLLAAYPGAIASSEKDLQRT